MAGVGSDWAMKVSLSADNMTFGKLRSASDSVTANMPEPGNVEDDCDYNM